MAVIIGYFTKVEIPTEVQVGVKIPLRVSYYAKLAGALAWSTCIMAKIDNDIIIVDTTRETGQEGGVGQTQEFKLFPMPNAKKTLYVRLLGHEAWSHQWTIADWPGG